MSRTTATVLFTDLVGSTELRGRLGEEAADELRRRHDQLLAQAVEANSGRVVKGLGDGIMATFSGASDAVAAAVAIQQAVDRLNRSGKAPVPLSVRVGLSAGDVGFEEDDVHGTPVIEASRLCAAAGGGEVLISEVVRLLAGPADDQVGDRGALELKGLAKPVPAWAIRWEPVATSTIPMPALLTDVGRMFVGRDAELERLGQLWKEAAAGERRVALLAGEPGVGKTRLAAEVAIRVHEEGGIVLAGRCDEDLGVPYQPFVAALRHFVEGAAAAELKERLGRFSGELARLLPELPGRLPDLPAPLQSDPETERYRLFDAVAVWLATASAEEPVLLVLDDLQWAAKPTLLLLRHVVRASETRRLFILGTYRDTELAHDHPLVELLADLRRGGGAERVSLSGLDDVAVAAMVEQAAGRALDDDGAALAQAIYHETEGNPFFVREVLRHLEETSAIQRDGDRWRTRVPVDQLGIPEGVRDVVGRRLSRLSEEANRTLRLAAVVGPEFEVDLVQSAGDLIEGKLLACFDEALEARLVSEVSPASYRFSHALVRATLYDSLSGARKVALHRHVAEAIERLHGTDLDDYLPALAHHWSKASAPAADTAKAAEYTVRAGDRALAQLANDEAASYYRQAIELVEAGHGPEAVRCDLLISLGEAQRRGGDPRHRDTLLDACRLALNLGDIERAARAALANQRSMSSRWEAIDTDRVGALEEVLDAVGTAPTVTRARILAALACELYFAADERRHGVAADALAIARAQDDPATLASVLAAAWYATWEPTNLAERARVVDELAELGRRLSDHRLEFDAGLGLFLTGMQQGDVRRADSGLDIAARVADDLAQPVLRWRVMYTRANRAIAVGDFARAEQLSAEAFAVGEACGQAAATVYRHAAVAMISCATGDFDRAALALEPFARELVPFKAAMAWVKSELGRNDEASDIVQEVADNRFAAVTRDHSWVMTLTFLGRASCRTGAQSGLFEQLYVLLLPHRAEVVVVPSVWTGPVAYDLGLLAAALGRYDEAETHFAAAVDVQTSAGTTALLAQTYVAWAEMVMSRGQPHSARARELVDHAVAMAKKLGQPHIAQRCRHLAQDPA